MQCNRDLRAGRNCIPNTYHTLQWRHNERDGVSNHQPQVCLLNHLFRRKSKKTIKLCVTGLCEGNSPVTGEFLAQRASKAENVSFWWRHHADRILVIRHSELAGVLSPGIKHFTRAVNNIYIYNRMCASFNKIIMVRTNHKEWRPAVQSIWYTRGYLQRYILKGNASNPEQISNKNIITRFLNVIYLHNAL